MRELMNDPELERAKRQQPRWRMPVLAAMVAFVVAIGAVGIAAFVGSEPEPRDDAIATTVTTAATPTTVPATTGAPTTIVPRPTPLTPEQQAIVDGFVEARNGADVEAFIALFAAGVQRRGFDPPTANEWFTTIEEIAGSLEADRAMGNILTAESCQSSTDYRFSCRMVFDLAQTRAMNIGPIVSQTLFEIDGDLITRWEGTNVHYPLSSFMEFGDWAWATRPDLAAETMVPRGWEYSYAADADPAAFLELLEEYAASLKND